jgi:hypothetical protein
MSEYFQGPFGPRPAYREGRRSWEVGDRVFAPWEPQFLYAGAIQEIVGEQAHIVFDDGDQGWARLEDLQPLDVWPGLEVLSRRKMGHLFSPAVVEEAHDQSVRIRFDSGEQEWTTVAALRLRREGGSAGAVPTAIASDLMFLTRLRVGDRVFAPWEAHFLYAGTVDQIQGGEAHVSFDDGDRGWVRLEQLRPLEVRPGLRVHGRWKMGAAYYPGEVVAVEGEAVRIHYDDGDREWARLAALRVLCLPAGPSARPTHFGSRPGPFPAALGWLIPVGIVLVLLLLRGGCQ